MTSNNEHWVVGVDGCKAGWISVALSASGWDLRLFPDIESLWKTYVSASFILIDIPIGLPNEQVPIRACDQLARKFLGFPRSTSIFSPPCRKALYADSYLQANEINQHLLGKGLSKQAWNISSKIREVDALLRKDQQARNVFKEAHPEVCFKGLSGHSMIHNKQKKEGWLERAQILRALYPYTDQILGQAAFPRTQAGADDLLDALALAVTGWLGKDRLTTFPHPSAEKDECGLMMELTYVAVT